MASVSVPQVPSALSVVRLSEGGGFSGVCVGPGVPVSVHWDGTKSYPCVGERGVCRGCVRAQLVQWQCFFPIRVPNGPVRLVLVGARSLRMGSIDDVTALAGREVSFRRPKGRRFVEVSLGLLEVPYREFDAVKAVAVLFGVHEFLPPDGDDRIERAYAARFRNAVADEVAK